MSDTTRRAAGAVIGILGGGPAGLVLAISLARRGIGTVVFERDVHPEEAPRFDAERSYTIDISGHGIKAIRYIEASIEFDQRMIPFKGLMLPDGKSLDCEVPGWTGSRGDIIRSLTAVIDGQHRALVDVRYGTAVEEASVETGTVRAAAVDGTEHSETFDLLVGADGAGSVVRADMKRRVPGFSTSRKSFANYCTMLELDQVDGRLDREYLHGLSTAPFVVAGAIMGDEGPQSSRWFCAVGTKREMTYASADEAHRYLQDHAPAVLDYASDEKIAAFANRKCYHIGQKLTCSQLHGGRAVLIGDAAAPFPPIGQGVNAAMESATALDKEIGRHGSGRSELVEAAQAYNAVWKPEADAVSWMSEKSLFENRFHMVRNLIAMKLGADMFEDAKSPTMAYSEAKRKADRIWPFWALP